MKVGKFTPEMRKKAIELAKTVNFKSTIARMLRMHVNTLESWLVRGAIDVDGNPIDDHPDVEEYVQFRLDFEAARAQLEVDIAQLAAAKQPTFVLERAYQHWNDKSPLGILNSDQVTPEAQAEAARELQGMGTALVNLIQSSWCNPDLAHAPAGVRQIWKALGERWGWS